MGREGDLPAFHSMKAIEGLQALLILAVVAILGYVAYTFYQLFGGGGSDYCNSNSNIWTSLFCGGTGTGGSPNTQCAGLGCTGSLASSYWCTWFPSTCQSSSSSPDTSDTSSSLSDDLENVLGSFGTGGMPY